MNESLFNDASPTNLHAVTSTISSYSCPWIQTNLACAPAQVVVFHLLHTDRMQLYTVSDKVHPLTFDDRLSCCNLSAILLINPLNTVRLYLHSHQRSSALSSLSDSAAESESWLFLPVSSPSLKLKVPLFLSSCPFLYSSRFLIHVCRCMYSCQLK